MNRPGRTANEGDACADGWAYTFDRRAKVWHCPACGRLRPGPEVLVRLPDGSLASMRLSELRSAGR